MAHFAQLNENGSVLRVIVVNNETAPTEEAGIAFLHELYKENNTIWKQTSFNTYAGVHYTEGEDRVRTPSADQSKAFRGNFASAGGHYDSVKDIFVGPKPYSSWDSYDDNGQWQSPVPIPTKWQIADGLWTQADSDNGDLPADKSVGDVKEIMVKTTFDEDNVRWVGSLTWPHTSPDLSEFIYYWNSSTETWDLI